MAECQCLHPTCIINTKLTNDKEKKRRENLTLHFEYFSMIKMKNEKKRGYKYTQTSIYYYYHIVSLFLFRCR